MSVTTPTLILLSAFDDALELELSSSLPQAASTPMLSASTAQASFPFRFTGPPCLDSPGAQGIGRSGDPHQERSPQRRGREGAGERGSCELAQGSIVQAPGTARDGVLPAHRGVPLR